jgi:hypothetical protein
MNFLETHYEDYISSKEKQNLHQKLEKIINKFPKSLNALKNIIYYGPSGVGKYTQMLCSIKKYSPSELKYEKKISVTYNKQQYFFKISDIHYEIDMSLLGCNSKLLWHEIYLQIIDIISTKHEKSGVIVCKNYHETHSELLENFYSYMQNSSSFIDIKYIFITESISFIPDNILNCCEIIQIQRPTKSALLKCLTVKPENVLKMEQITNIKNIHCSIDDLMHPYKIICDKIIKEMIGIDDLKFLHFRDILYDIFIYNLDIFECIWYIISFLLNNKYIKKECLSKILIKTYNFLQYYNNNYRPIYHLESYLFYLTSNIHGFTTSV